MNKLFLPAVVCTLWLMFTESAAADIVYKVNDTVDGGSAVGTITTDGALGPLFTTDIVNFNLMLSDQTATATLADGVNGGTVFMSGGAITATPTVLTFNFGASGSFVNFFTSPGCEPIWTLRGSGGSACNTISGPVDAIQVSATSTPAMVAGVGTKTIAAVPEPGSLGLIVVGLVSLIGFRKLRF